jgi:hypothetical protein
MTGRATVNVECVEVCVCHESSRVSQLFKFSNVKDDRPTTNTMYLLSTLHILTIVSNMSADMIASARHTSPEALLDAFHAAASDSDLDAYFGCFSEHGHFLGTEATERWSANEFYDYARPHFQAKQGWKYIPQSRSVQHHMDSFCTFDELLEAVASREFSTVRGTGSLICQQGHWFIAAYHLTFPVPNEIAVEVCQRIKQYEFGEAETAADKAAAELIAQEEEQSPKKIQIKKKNKK